MTKENRKKLLVISTLMLVGGLIALAWGFYVSTNLSMVANSFMGQLSMAAGQMNRAQIAKDLANARTAMSFGVFIAPAGLILLLIGLIMKPKSDSGAAA